MKARQDVCKEVLLMMHICHSTPVSMEARNTICSMRERVRVRLRANHLQANQDPKRAEYGEAGGALVELALVLPLLMLIVTGIFAFGITLNNYLELTDAVSIGARQLAISRGQTTDPCATAVSAIESAAPFLKTTSLSFSFVLNGVAYPSSGSSTTSCSSSSTTTGPAANLVQGAAVQVTASYPCSLAIYSNNLVPTCNLVAQTTELVQ